MVNYIKIILRFLASIPSLIILIQKIIDIIKAWRLRKAQEKKDKEIDDAFSETEQDGDSSHIEDIYSSNDNS